MVKVERSFPAPTSLSFKESYREADVISRLRNDFYDKCYICELKLSDINVEHLLPHKNIDLDRKFDWENLFLSCPHCNEVKNNSRYEEKILDCCKVDPEEKISFEFKGNEIEVLSKNPQDEQAVKTAELIYEVFNIKNTGIREFASDFRFKKLQKEMLIFLQKLEEYRNNKQSFFNFRILKELLKRESEFAAFKRNYIRKNIKVYPELEEVIK